MIKGYHRLTRANTPDSVSFRCFLPFSPWLAPASLRLKNQKSLENTSLAGASSFVGAEIRPDKKRPAGNTCRIAKGLDAVWAHFCPSKPCLLLLIDGNRRQESCKIAGKVILQLFPDAYLMKISVSPSIYRPVLLSFAASVPHFPLTPRGVKADGAHLLRPLHGVDGQLPRGGGGADGGGIVHRVENRSGGKQCRAAHHVPPPQQKYPYLLHIEFAPFCHNLCGGGAEKKRRDRTPEKPLFAGLAPQNSVQCSGQQEPRLRQCEKTFPGGRSTVIDLHFQKTRI